MTEIINNTLTGRTAEAVKLAEQVGMTEEAFQKKGGGPIFWGAIATSPASSLRARQPRSQIA